MLVRIQLRRGRRFQNKQGKNRQLALAIAALLTPATLMAWVLGFWKLASDMGLAGEFAISHGIFSHYQVWLPLAVVLQIAIFSLNRYGRGGALRIPSSLYAWLPTFFRSRDRAESR